MMSLRSHDTSEQAFELQIEIFRNISPQERMRRASELYKSLRSLLAQGVQARHPEYTPEQVRLAVIRLTLPEDLFLAAYPQASDVFP